MTDYKINSYNNFQYLSEKFADVQILRYQVPEFYQLSIREQIFAYYLSRAAYAGRDILYDQYYKHNLWIRKHLEALYKHARVDREAPEFQNLDKYLKRLWFANGIHHHYSTKKFYPDFPASYLNHLIAHTPVEALKQTCNKPRQLAENLAALLFSEKDSRRTLQDDTQDLLLNSAVNFYENVPQEEAEAYYHRFPQDGLSYGLNSKLVKHDGQLREYVWHADGLYGKAIRQIIHWLNKAKEYAPNELQQQTLQKLVEFYQTGSLQAFNEYNILWLQNPNPKIDTINGFIEVYDDPLGIKGSWEGLVLIRDDLMTHKTAILSRNAQWFEDNLPVDDAHKRQNVKGVAYNVVQVLAESGDSSPATPIGINLPNADWIRAKYGSKSVSLSNIEDAHHEVSKNDGTLEEFYLPQQAELIRDYGKNASKLLVALHEVIGHGSGKLEDQVAPPARTLKNYASTIEEARADLVALYYLPDVFLKEEGLTNDYVLTGKAAYEEYIVNGLMLQLMRIEEGGKLEEAHMRNRQLVALYALQHGKPENVVEQVTRNGKTFFRINNYEALRSIFGQLLQEVQRIKSQGDYKAAAKLVNRYGTHIEQSLHKEVLQRFKNVSRAPYSGFINPTMKPNMMDGQINSVSLYYPDSFSEQMLYYASNYSNL